MSALRISCGASGCNCNSKLVCVGADRRNVSGTIPGGLKVGCLSIGKERKVMNRTLRTFHLVTLYCCLALAVTAQNTALPRGITPEDYYSFEFASDPHI